MAPFFFASRTPRCSPVEQFGHGGACARFSANKLLRAARLTQRRFDEKASGRQQRWSRGSLSGTSSPLVANDVLYTSLLDRTRQ